MKKRPKLKFPFSYRYCGVCETITICEYNKVIGHGECTECGSHFGKGKERYEQIEEVQP